MRTHTQIGKSPRARIYTCMGTQRGVEMKQNKWKLENCLKLTEIIGKLLRIVFRRTE